MAAIWQSRPIFLKLYLIFWNIKKKIPKSKNYYVIPIGSIKYSYPIRLIFTTFNRNKTFGKVLKPRD